MRALTRNMISIFIGLIMIYNSLVEPYFEYCSNVLDSLGNGLSAKLQFNSIQFNPLFALFILQIK